MGTGAYQMLKEMLASHPNIRYRFFTLLKADCSHISNEADELCDVLMTASAGQEFADSQLRNIYSPDGDQFNPIALKNALDTYPTFMTHTPDLDTRIAYLGIDPSGTGHKWGWFLLGQINNMLFEIDSGTIQMGDLAQKEQWSPQRMQEFFLALCRAHMVRKVAIESNTGGKIVELFLRQHGVNVMSQNFGADNTPQSRHNFIMLARKMIDEAAFVFKNHQLYQQLLIYNPTKSSDDKLKGDLADASLHAIWIAMNGFKGATNQPTPKAVFYIK
jgi:hypothetical protein